MQVKLKKGKNVVSFPIDDDKILKILLGKDTKPLSDSQICQTIEQGILEATPKDVAGKKTCIIIPDNTRLWARGEDFVPVIVKSLEALDVAPTHITILIALGTHADIDEELIPKLAGNYSCKTVKVLNSANQNSSRLVNLGTTSRGTKISLTKELVEAQHVIIFGGVLHHMIAGFGGGRKYIFPGVAGYDSIQQNHSLSLNEKGLPHAKVRQTQLTGNPVHEDIEEISNLVLQDRSCTYACVAVNGEGDIFHAAVGDLKPTFQDGCIRLDDACSAKISQQADFVICSAGGHRTDGQLYQSVKALFNGVEALKPGGHLILVAECIEGVGNQQFAEALTKYSKAPARLGEQLRITFNMPSYIALRVIELLDKYQIALVSSFSKEQTEALGFSYVQDVSNYVNKIDGRGYIIPYAENILPILR